MEGAEAMLATSELGPFSRRVQSTGLVYLRAKAGGGGFPMPTMTLTSIGRVFLAVTNSQRTQALNVDLEISDEAVDVCTPAMLVDNYSMSCTP